jgi:serine/threonine protein kinase
MPLTPGTKLGPYEIHSALGAGGMGEVYRANDTRLSRTVAVHGRRNNRYVYVASLDGQKFLVIRPLEDASTRPLTVVQNWTELLKK